MCATIGGSASAIVTFVNPLGSWGGGNCPIGFQFQASAQAKAQTGAGFDGRWNLNECFNNSAGFTGGSFSWNGVSASLEVNASTHGVRIELATDVLTLFEGESWPL